jgi:hypothetical protein
MLMTSFAAETEKCLQTKASCTTSPREIYGCFATTVHSGCRIYSVI